MNSTRVIIFVAVALAMVCLAVAFPDPAGGYGGIGGGIGGIGGIGGLGGVGGIGGGPIHRGFSSNVVVSRPVVRRVVGVSHGGIRGIGGIGGIGRGYGW